MVCTRILDWFVVAISHTFSTNIFRYPTASIGLIASLSIAINSLTGPAMLNLPATFQRSGLIPTTLCLVFVGVLSALCSLHMADIVSKVPNNSKFKLDVGFSGAFETFCYPTMLRKVPFWRASEITRRRSQRRSWTRILFSASTRCPRRANAAACPRGRSTTIRSTTGTFTSSASTR